MSTPVEDRSKSVSEADTESKYRLWNDYVRPLLSSYLGTQRQTRAARTQAHIEMLFHMQTYISLRINAKLSM